MRVGVMILPERRWPESIKVWQAAEELGFDSAWTYDHLWWRSLRDDPWLATFPTLTAAACVTQRIRLGTMVTSPSFRNPVVTAKDAIAIDDVSQGRFTLGVGAGSVGAGDANVIGRELLSPADRAVRFGEFVEVLDLLLRDPVVDYEGRFYSVREARSIPGCVQQPRLPIAAAAPGPKGMAVAAKYADAWVTCGDPDFSRHYEPDAFRAVVRDQVERFSRACRAAGRDGTDVDRILVTTDSTGDLMASVDDFVQCAAQYAEIGITDMVIHWPRTSGVFAGDVSRLYAIADKGLPRVRRLVPASRPAV